MEAVNAPLVMTLCRDENKNMSRQQTNGAYKKREKKWGKKSSWHTCAGVHNFGDAKTFAQSWYCFFPKNV